MWALVCHCSFHILPFCVNTSSASYPSVLVVIPSILPITPHAQLFQFLFISIYAFVPNLFSFLAQCVPWRTCLICFHNLHPCFSATPLSCLSSPLTSHRSHSLILLGPPPPYCLTKELTFFLPITQSHISTPCHHPWLCERSIIVLNHWSLYFAPLLNIVDSIQC
jgi:hypothetical protein